MLDEQEIQRLRDQLATHRATLEVLRTQFNGFTFLHTPPPLIYTIRETQQAIKQTKQRLRNLGDLVEDLPNDSVPSEEELSGRSIAEEDPIRNNAPIANESPSFSRKYRLAISLILISGTIIGILLGYYLLMPEEPQPTPVASCDIPSTIRPNEIPVLVTKLEYSPAVGDQGYESTIRNELTILAKEIQSYQVTLLPIPCDITLRSRSEAEDLSKTNPAYANSIILWGNVNTLGGALYIQRFGTNAIDISASTAPTSTTRLGFTSLLNPEYLRFFAYYAASQSFFLVENYTDTLPLINQALAHINRNSSIRLQGLGHAYFQLGWSQLAIEDADIALTTLETGLAISHNTQPIDHDAEYLLAYHSSYIHSYYGDNASYLDKDRDREYQQAFDVLAPFLKIRGYRSKPALYNQLGYIKYQQEEYDQALDYLWTGYGYQLLHAMFFHSNKKQQMEGSILKNLGLVYYELEKSSGRFTYANPLLLLARKQHLDAGPRMQVNLALFSITDTVGIGDCEYLLAADADRQTHTYELNGTADSYLDGSGC
jgi:tetratricopeptide (TPR) repeat protein